jgi:hypothetical protein
MPRAKSTPPDSGRWLFDNKSDAMVGTIEQVVQAILDETITWIKGAASADAAEMRFAGAMSSVQWIPPVVSRGFRLP